MHGTTPTLATVERQLVRVVGPMARILVRQAATQAHDAARALCDARRPHRRPGRARALRASGDRRSQWLARVATDVGCRSYAPHDDVADRRSGRTRPLPPLEQEFVDQTTSRLAVYLGPIAKVVAHKAARQARDSEEFVQLVAEHIGTQDRESFLKDVGTR